MIASVLRQSSRAMSSAPSLAVVLNALEKFAPTSRAESWDNVGLLIEPGDLSRDAKIINRTLLTNDLTSSVVEEAVTVGADLVISYHPPIFAPLKRVTQNTWKERVVSKCLEKGIAVYSPHTAWDNSPKAITNWLCSAFGNAKIEPLISCGYPRYLVEVYGPAPEIIELLTSSDESSLPDVLSCSDASNERSCYKAVVGQDTLKKLKEKKFLLTSYELPSQDGGGSGRIVKPSQEIELHSCIQMVKAHTGLQHVRLARANSHTNSSVINSIAVVCGSGASLLKGVNADLYLTGEMLHHDLLEANHNNTSVILTNHSDSERGFLKVFKDHMREWFPEMDVHLALSDKDPIDTV